MLFLSYSFAHFHGVAAGFTCNQTADQSSKSSELRVAAVSWLTSAAICSGMIEEKALCRCAVCVLWCENHQLLSVL